MIPYISIGDGLYQFVYKRLPSGPGILSAEFDLTSHNLTDKWGHLLRAGRDMLPEEVDIKEELDLFFFHLTSYHEDFEDGNKETPLPTKEELIAYWLERGFAGFEYPLFN